MFSCICLDKACNSESYSSLHTGSFSVHECYQLSLRLKKWTSIDRGHIQAQIRLTHCTTHDSSQRTVSKDGWLLSKWLLETYQFPGQ
ncbi:hypothetical protein AGIG_G8425 [Arapaima gigas]